MRNSVPNSSSAEDDYLISPIKADDGTFFDTRDQVVLGKDAKLPIDADANGAYHIALKGLYLLKNNFNRNDKGFIENISNADWFSLCRKKNIYTNPTASTLARTHSFIRRADDLGIMDFFMFICVILRN